MGAPLGAVQAAVLAPCSPCQAGAAPCLLWGVRLRPDFNHASLARSLFSSQRRRVAFFLMLMPLGLPQPAQRPVAGDVRPGAGAPRCPFSCHVPCLQTLRHMVVFGLLNCKELTPRKVAFFVCWCERDAAVLLGQEAKAWVKVSVWCP